MTATTSEPADAGRRHTTHTRVGPSTPAALPVTEAAAYLGCSTRTVENRIAAGWLPRYKNGHLVLVDLDDVDAMITRTAQRR